MANHDNLKDTKEFNSFTNEAQFDEGLFLSDENVQDFPYCTKITDNMKSKIIGVFSNFFGYKEEVRKISDKENQLKRFETHFRNVSKKYRDILLNMINYSKTIQSQASEYRNLSKISYFLKDTFNGNEEKENFKNYYKYANDLYVTNRKYYINSILNMQNKLVVKFINIGL